MTLLAPLGLLALITLPLIFLLHLRRERLRRVLVPSLMLWQHVPLNTGTRRKWLLPFTLLLLLHLLAALLLALALTQPQWLGQLFGGSQQHIAVVLDTSTSMAARESNDQTRLDLARDQVQALLGSLAGEASLTLVATNPQPAVLGTATSENQAALLTLLDSLEPGGTGTSIASALTLAQVALEEQTGGVAEAGRLVVLSDLGPPAALDLPPEQLAWQRIGEAVNNQGIVVLSARPRRGSDTAGYDVFARVVNYDTLTFVVTLRLYADDQEIDIRQLDLQGNGEAELTWNLPAGTQVVRAELEINDALPADNVAYLSLTQIRPIRTLVIADSAPDLLRALDAIPNVQASLLDPTTYAMAPPEADITIFKDLQPTALPVGGTLLINPPLGAAGIVTATEVLTTNQAGSVLPEPVRLADNAGPALEGLALSGVDFGSVVGLDAPGWLQPQLLRGDAPLIMRGARNERNVAIWSFDLAQSTLTDKLAFPLLLARTVADLTPPAPPTALHLGEALTVQPNPRTDTLLIGWPDGQSQQVPVTHTVRIEGFTQPGLYRFAEQAGEQVLFESQFAVNAGSPLESDLTARPMPAAPAPYVGRATPGSDASGETLRRLEEPLWPWLAGAALLVMLLEWLYVHLR